MLAGSSVAASIWRVQVNCGTTYHTIPCGSHLSGPPRGGSGCFANIDTAPARMEPGKVWWHGRAVRVDSGGAIELLLPMSEGTASMRVTKLLETTVCIYILCIYIYIYRYIYLHIYIYIHVLYIYNIYIIY